MTTITRGSLPTRGDWMLRSADGATLLMPIRGGDGGLRLRQIDPRTGRALKTVDRSVQDLVLNEGYTFIC